ncbi:nuclease-related domain-containing protein [Microbacterium sp. 4NA327F11]|uniref:nuclease-related domain-containing protein n=1 Tax=Microbacterium sp. 4NA327F11 TaxID=2502229 RepID=UPI0010F58D42|nr:nuclease-related domain-containing protein [Microbacterium sp. 4NA327F11]
MVTRAPSGGSVGRAGSSLEGAPAWASSGGASAAGRSGELRTAAALDELASRPGGPTVLHDLRIPIRGFRANIDHVVIAGTTIILIDSKVWRPGFYWTGRRGTWRGFDRVEHADRRTLDAARTGLGALLRNQRVPPTTIARSMLAIWPSHGRLFTALYRPTDARAVPGPRLSRVLARTLPRESAHPAIVAALRPLVR